jgi:hypothetical protein
MALSDLLHLAAVAQQALEDVMHPGARLLAMLAAH